MLTDEEKTAARKGRLLKNENNFAIWAKGDER